LRFLGKQFLKNLPDQDQPGFPVDAAARLQELLP